MAQPKAKGSLIYEILIVILIALLISSILYPKKLIEKEDKNIQTSHYRMEQIQRAALQYQKYNGVYTDTLSKIFEFIKTSPQYAQYVDSVITGGLDTIITRLSGLKTQQDFITQNIPSATDSIMIDSLSEMQDKIKMAARQLAGFVEFVHDRMKNLPNMPLDDLTSAFVIIDSKKFTLDMDIVMNSLVSGDLEVALQGCQSVINVINSVINQVEVVEEKVPNYRSESLDSLGFCPTTGKSYQLVHVDTSVIKYLNIYSPIDSSDIALVEHDFLKSKIGGLKIENHGKIESGEKSWEAEK